MKRISLIILICSLALSSFAQIQRGSVITRERSDVCTKKNMFGLYYGGSLGSVKFQADNFQEKSTGIGILAGYRWTTMITPNIGVDWKIVDANFVTTNEFSVFDFTSNTYVSSLLGVRGQSPIFYKCMSGYGVVRLGYGVSITSIELSSGSGGLVRDYYYYRNTKGAMGFEIEFGLNLAPWFYVGYNFQTRGIGKEFENRNDDLTLNFDKVGVRTHSFTFGFNLGKRQNI